MAYRLCLILHAIEVVYGDITKEEIGENDKVISKDTLLRAENLVQWLEAQKYDLLTKVCHYNSSYT